MIELFLVIALRTRCALPTQALLFGALLGWVVWELSRVAPGSGYTFAMALVLLVSGATSFVLYALHTLETRGDSTREAHGGAARNILSLLGCGLAAAMQGLQASVG